MARKHRSGRWEATHRVRTPDGQRKRLSAYSDTPKGAHAKLDKKVEEFELSCLDIYTVQGFALNCYAPTVSHLTDGTRQQIKWALVNHIFPAFGNRELKDVSRQDIQNFLTARLKHLSVSSVGHIRKVLHAIWHLAEADGLVRNVVEPTKLPPDRKLPIPVYSAKQCWSLIEAAEGHPVAAPIFLAAFAGLRRGECLALRRTDIKVSGLQINKQSHRQLGKMVDTELKTDSSYRTVPVSKEFIKILRRLINTDSEYVCASEGGGRMIQENIDRALYAAEERAGLHKVTFHQLRHSFSTNLQDLGCPEEIRASLLGHSKRSMTQHYTQMSRHQSRNWLRKLVCTKLDTSNTASNTANGTDQTPEKVDPRCR